jgi:dolichol-phosphate mannosyltransferase
MDLEVSVIILTRNEEDQIKKVIEALAEKFKLKKLRGEIIVVDDSTDNTFRILLNLAKIYKFLKIVRGRGKGFGNALKLGIEKATKDIIIPYNGDGSDNPSDVMKLVNEINKGYDAVFGSRFIKGGRVIGHPFFKYLATKIGNFSIKVLLRVPFNDFTNLLKAYKKNFIKKINLESNDFSICVELPLKAIKKGGKIAQVPVTWRERKKGVSKMNTAIFIFKYLSVVFKIFFTKQ